MSPEPGGVCRVPERTLAATNLTCGPAGGIACCFIRHRGAHRRRSPHFVNPVCTTGGVIRTSSDVFRDFTLRLRPPAVVRDRDGSGIA